MAEVGLLPFAHIALQVSKAVLPRYRSRFSKQQFNQPHSSRATGLDASAWVAKVLAHCRDEDVNRARSLLDWYIKRGQATGVWRDLIGYNTPDGDKLDHRDLWRRYL